AEEGAAPSVECRRDLRLAAAHAAWQSAHAVDLMYHAGGGSSVHASSPLQRCFRDVHVVTQHFLVNSAIYDTTGRLYLGVGAAPPNL
ncbi:MAG: acyl-CoA dehydrogenase family protein, partial [Candidatus Binataceae bacterium]